MGVQGPGRRTCLSSRLRVCQSLQLLRTGPEGSEPPCCKTDGSILGPFHAVLSPLRGTLGESFLLGSPESRPWTQGPVTAAWGKGGPGRAGFLVRCVPGLGTSEGSSWPSGTPPTSWKTGVTFGTGRRWDGSCRRFNFPEILKQRIHGPDSGCTQVLSIHRSRFSQ